MFLARMTTISTMESICLSNYTCVLRDLSLGDHLFAFRVHEFTILVLFQALEHALSIGFGAETLQRQKARLHCTTD